MERVQKELDYMIFFEYIFGSMKYKKTITFKTEIIYPIPQLVFDD